MNIMSFDFFVFIGITLIAYYKFKDLQKYILLFASIIFFANASHLPFIKFVTLSLGILCITYFSAIIIDTVEDKYKKVVALFAILSLGTILFVFKWAYNLANVIKSVFSLDMNISFLELMPILGISYFVLSAIGYILEVSWSSYPAEKNIGIVALFIYYFPQLISGPITRFDNMREKFIKQYDFSYNRFSNGINRMIWGYFKKLVISERFGYQVSTIYLHYESFSALEIYFASLCYAVRLYTDFSGCMDIIIGASELFGIELPENFNCPFVAKSMKEFWRRWHITLGGWSRDYILYPIQMSVPMKELLVVCKKKFGKKIGKRISFYLSMSILWMFIGIWHGGNAYWFLSSGVIPCLVIILSDILEQQFNYIVKILRINRQNIIYKAFQSFRTISIMAFAWIFVCALGVRAGVRVIIHMFSTPLSFDINKLLHVSGLSLGAYGIMILGMALVVIDEYLIYKGSSIVKILNVKPHIIRNGFIYMELLLILFKGLVGTSNFIYFNF